MRRSRPAQQQIGGVDRSRLIGPIGRATNTLADKLTALRSTTASAARIARLAPPMLGAAAPRKYLVVFQNLAEPRATGGIFGSYALLEVNRGAVSVNGQGASSRTISPFDPPLPLPPSASRDLFGTLPGVYPTDVNLVPDYPTAAALFARMYQLREGNTVDGGAGHRSGRVGLPAGRQQAHRHRPRPAAHLGRHHPGAVVHRLPALPDRG